MRCFSILLVLTISFALFADSAYQYPEWVTDEMKDNIPEIELIGILRRFEWAVNHRPDLQKEDIIKQTSSRLDEISKEYKSNPEKKERYFLYYKNLNLNAVEIDFEKNPPPPPWLTKEMKDKIPRSYILMYSTGYYSDHNGSMETSAKNLMKDNGAIEEIKRNEKNQLQLRYRTMQIIAQEQEIPEQFIYLMPNFQAFFDYWSYGRGGWTGKNGGDVFFTINPRFESVVMTIWSRKKPIAMPQIEWEYNSSWSNISWLDRCKIGTLLCVISEIENRAKELHKYEPLLLFGSDREVLPDDMEVVRRLIYEMIRMASTESRNQAQTLFRVICFDALKKWGDQEWKWEKPKELIEFTENLKASQNTNALQSNDDFWPKTPERPYRDDDWNKINGKGRDIMKLLEEKGLQVDLDFLRQQEKHNTIR